MISKFVARGVAYFLGGAGGAYMHYIGVGTFDAILIVALLSLSAGVHSAAGDA